MKLEKERKGVRLRGQKKVAIRHQQWCVYFHLQNWTRHVQEHAQDTPTRNRFRCIFTPSKRASIHDHFSATCKRYCKSETSHSSLSPTVHLGLSTSNIPRNAMAVGSLRSSCWQHRLVLSVYQDEVRLAEFERCAESQEGLEGCQ